jgi:hypothetical protein
MLLRRLASLDHPSSRSAIPFVRMSLAARPEGPAWQRTLWLCVVRVWLCVFVLCACVGRVCFVRVCVLCVMCVVKTVD